MKTRSNLGVLTLFVMMTTMLVACGSDGNDESGNTSSLTAANLTEEGYFDGMLYYQITSNSPLEVSVAKASKSASTVEIPTSVNIEGKTYRCTSIGQSAFSGCRSLTHVKIPSCVNKIGDGAFANCSLRDITIPGSVTTLGKWVFANSTNLTSVVIEEGVDAINERDFNGCSGLRSVQLPSSVCYIGLSAFEDCTSLTSIDIPGHIEVIDMNAFAGCTSLNNLNTSNYVFCIGVLAFYGCANLATISFDADLIGEGAFYGCPNVRTIRFKGPTAPQLFSSAVISTNTGHEYSIEIGYSNRKTSGGVSEGHTSFDSHEYNYNTMRYEDLYIFEPEVYSNATIYVKKRVLDSHNWSMDWGYFTNVVTE